MIGRRSIRSLGWSNGKEWDRVIRIVDNRNAFQYQCFGYDHRSRLVSAFTTGNSACSSYDGSVGAAPYNHTYSYNTRANLTSASGVGTHNYNNSAHDGAVTSVTSGPTTVHSFSYDQAGNLTTRSISGQNSQTLSWDASNRLSQVTQTGSPTRVFLYDADGNRVARRDGTTVTVQIDNQFEWTATSGFVSY
jgi:YD repeat-containing protein